ncbi:ABC transporter permease [Nonomuraea sp. NBC_00507]|uniref:ABC transporter permease n=1 Tax=Nonomuraea sp. NBC_00507 TaxID=2976002 RepID=UPI002E198CAC
MPGLFAMVTFSAWLGVMTRVAANASRGVMDRFRSMPMARLAVPVGQTGADLLTGLLMIVLRYALSWVGGYVGLAVKNDQVADAMVPLGLPFTMLSNAFVPTGGMPGWLRFLADWNPVSALTAAARQLFGNPGAPSGNVAWPLAHPVTAVLLWSAALLVIFIPLSLRAYMRRGR